MKEIGEKLKKSREEIGVTIEEVAEDLKIDKSQIEDIEQGNMEAFKDIFSLKYFIRDYSKYLGLNTSDMIDEFNEYLFDYTSKLSIEDIKKEKKISDDSNESGISSPYTKEHVGRKNIPKIIIFILLILVLVVIIYFVVITVSNKDKAKQEYIINNIIR